ncbi:MAG: protein kinase [Planctomycetia bacterium]|nr:protein kinase [Planctomycetia bacterium]
MFALFECVALAVKNKGIRGLCEMVPGGSYLFDIAGEAYRLFRERKRDRALRDELAQIAVANSELAKKTAEEVARQVAHDAKPDEQLALELYLTQMPGVVRQSLKRAEDPSGKTVPPDFAVDSPEDLAKMLPARVPHFRPGADLPGRPGWKLEELLGAGGFGEVWLSRHTFIPHPRAVKFCTDEKVRAKLTSHEGRVIARVMAQGSHPNVVPLLDAVLDGETPWLMYEFVGGGNLTDLILKWQSLPNPNRSALAIGSLLQLASAVGTFHRLNPPIVHRDLKPANILLSAELGTRNAEPKADGGETSSVLSSALRVPSSALKITDFGIGGVAVDYLRTQAPGLSLVTGWLETSMRGSYTPLYASPQQARGNAPDPRDDVHALGVIAFQMLTGKLTEAPGTRFERELRRRGVPDGFIELIGDCVDTEPTGRPKDASELAERLGKCQQLTKTIAGSTNPVSTKPERVRQAEGTKLNPPTPEGKGEKDKPASGSAFPSGKVVGAAGPKDSPAPTALEGGSHGLKPTATPVAATKWLVPLRGLWFSRSTESPDAPWSLNGAKLPGEVTTKPGEAYRIALNPDTTGDEELAKLRSLSGLAGLEAVDLSGCVRVTDAGLMHLAHLRGLKAVALAETQVTDSGVTLLLTRFPELEAVSLSGAANVSQSVIPYLARMRKLKVLSLPPRADTTDVRVEFARRKPGCQLV